MVQLYRYRYGTVGANCFCCVEISNVLPAFALIVTEKQSNFNGLQYLYRYTVSIRYRTFYICVYRELSGEGWGSNELLCVL
jgi:hypothetical protein